MSINGVIYVTNGLSYYDYGAGYLKKEIWLTHYTIEILISIAEKNWLQLSVITIYIEIFQRPFIADSRGNLGGLPHFNFLLAALFNFKCSRRWIGCITFIAE